MAIEALRRFAQAATSEKDVHCWVQLSHAGRQSNFQVAKKCPAPSAIKPETKIPLPDPWEMSIEEIKNTVGKYAHAAKVAKQVGFTGVQLHSAHGYLLSSFFNPLANQRTDCYGGSLEKRARFLLECIRAVREQVGPEFPVAVKINSSDFQKGGFSHQDAVKVAAWLDEAGLDLLEISGGNYENGVLLTGIEDNFKTMLSLQNLGKRSSGKCFESFWILQYGMANRSDLELREAYFLKYAADICKSLKKTPLMVTGGFRSRKVMEDALASNDVSVIGIGRPLCVKTDCVGDLLDGRIDKLPAPENQWDLPWLARWTRYLIFGNLMKIAGELCSYYWNLYRIGAGEKPLVKPNLLRAMVVVSSKDEAKARNLKGLPENDPSLHYHTASTTKLVPIVLTCAFAVTLYYLIQV